MNPWILWNENVNKYATMRNFKMGQEIGLEVSIMRCLNEGDKGHFFTENSQSPTIT